MLSLTHLVLAVDGHVSDAGLLLQPLLKIIQLFWRHKELDVRLLVDIPAAEEHTMPEGRQGVYKFRAVHCVCDQKLPKHRSRVSLQLNK